LLLANSKIK